MVEIRNVVLIEPQPAVSLKMTDLDIHSETLKRAIDTVRFLNKNKPSRKPFEELLKKLENIQ